MTIVQVIRGVEGSKAWKTVMSSLLVEGDLIRLATVHSMDTFIDAPWIEDAYLKGPREIAEVSS